MPSFSVITVCYNDKQALIRTISSVQQQEYEIEHIIIDGGSTDGSLEIIKGFSQKSNQKLLYLSERDNGVYDAINKGVQLSTSEYLLVLNAGDTFCSNHIISEVFQSQYFVNQAYLIGRVNYLYSSGKKKADNSKFASQSYLECSHQAFIYKRALHDEIGKYNLSYKSASDYDFFSKIYKSYGLIQSEKLPFFIAKREKFGGDMSDSIMHSWEMIKIDISHNFIANTFFKRTKEIIIKLIRSL
ncbi:hypothetical protein CWO01_14845 [Vibrio splendidus]|uniref:glycosyltransferase n=1 Tax=Vibrio splendidus TaxID=29497 RepID=UPI000D362278|nr:glycosyltransferase [Vibrio splendidus]PTP60925.1 hypothetical protein CWO01_14845 [Vibrio splendidus]